LSKKKPSILIQNILTKQDLNKTRKGNIALDPVLKMTNTGDYNIILSPVATSKYYSSLISLREILLSHKLSYGI